jgi:hypothetical protein
MKMSLNKPAKHGVQNEHDFSPKKIVATLFYTRTHASTVIFCMIFFYLILYDTQYCNTTIIFIRLFSTFLALLAAIFFFTRWFSVWGCSGCSRYSTVIQTPSRSCASGECAYVHTSMCIRAYFLVVIL